MADVCIRILGRLAILVGEIDARPRGRKAGVLLGVLALSPDGTVARDRMAELLWSDRGEEQARGSLRQALAEIRAGPLGGADAVAIGRDVVALVPGRVTTDVAAILSACEVGDARDLARQMAGVDGVLLNGCDGLSPGLDQWLRVERARQHERIIGAVLARGALLLSEAVANDLQSILRALDLLDPANEVVARLGLEADHRAGDLAGLHRRYRRLSADLQREFGARPSEETRVLFARLSASNAGGVGPLGERPGTASASIDHGKARTPPIVMVNPITALGGSLVAEEIAGLATDEIRIALGRHSEVRVAMLDGLDLDRVEQVCGQAYAAYMLSGRVREVDGEMRVMLQLSNVRSRIVVWSEQIHVDRAHVSDAVDRIVACSVGAVGPAIDRDLGAELRRRPLTPDERADDAVALYARGRHLARAGRTLEAVRQGMALMEKAIARDPAHVGARLLLAQLYNTDLWQQVAGHDVAAYRAKALALVLEAAVLEPENVRIGIKLAWCYLRRHNWEICERRLNAAVNACPYDAEAVNESAVIALHLGDLNRAGVLMQRAFSLNPFPPADYHADFALLCAMRGEPEAAEEHFEASGETKLQYVAARLANISALPRAGETRTALRDEFLARFADAWVPDRAPEIADMLDWLEYTYVFRQPEHRGFWRERFSAGLA